jgi:hypothetical protein
VTFDSHILVDQFGYRPNDPKVAVIRSPQTGFDASSKFTPGSNYQVVSADTGNVVLSGTTAAWNGSATESSSGDQGWWFDFSQVTTPGNYFVYDTTDKVRSATFSVNQNVYKNVLKAAMRMYYYQREGSSGSNGGIKQAPYAEACWTDGASYLGANQDIAAHDVTDQSNSSKVHDLSGGWADAGDTNKYVTFANTAVHQLLSAYQENPAVFTDDFNIPESGNGIPDVIDEVKYEVDWLKKMQFSSDGSVALKVGETSINAASPPSSDTAARFYVPSCTSSTIAAAGMFAHAAYVYSKISQLASEASSLQTRAINAWNNYQGIATKQENCDTGVVRAGIADWPTSTQNGEAVVAAVWLFALTGDATYGSYIAAHYKDTWPYHDIGWGRYYPEQGKALLFYTTLSNASATLKQSILADKLADVSAGNQIYGLTATDDLYRNFMHSAQYVWGSNETRSNYGNTNADVVTFSGIGAPNVTASQTRALETMHYFHGVNPFGKVLLSNMYSYGATLSTNEIFHSWYQPGGKWADAKTASCGPAPGYLPGGANANAAGDSGGAIPTPPAGQPAQKSWRDWNGVVGDPQSSWVVNEPGIYYQSAYVELLSRYAN